MYLFKPCFHLYHFSHCPLSLSSSPISKVQIGHRQLNITILGGSWHHLLNVRPQHQSVPHNAPKHPSAP